MKFRLYDDTPKHRDAFIRLAQEGYYNGPLFYRVLKDLLIQGGSKSTKNARPGEKVGFGDPDKKVECEIRPDHFHKRGALCAPRQPDEINPTRQSDISQFYIVKGKVYREDELDTMELAVNLPIRNSIIKKVYTQEIKDKLLILREQKKVEEFRAIANQVKSEIDKEYNSNPNVIKYSAEQRKAYTTVGGYPDLDGKYTVFGECISGFDVIDKIASLKTDKNDRPYTDVKIKVTVLN